MELKDAIEQRTSIRTFSTEPVNPDDLREIVRLAGFAPSVNNFQPWKFIAVLNSDVLIKMSEAVLVEIASLPMNESKAAKNLKSQVAWFSTFFEEAPAIIAIAAEPYESILEKAVILKHDDINRMRNYPDIQSLGACVQNLLLASVDLGYGACWISGPMIAGPALEEILGISAPWKLQTMVALGKPKEKVKPKTRKNFGKELIIID